MEDLHSDAGLSGHQMKILKTAIRLRLPKTCLSMRKNRPSKHFTILIGCLVSCSAAGEEKWLEQHKEVNGRALRFGASAPRLPFRFGCDRMLGKGFKKIRVGHFFGGPQENPHPENCASMALRIYG